jgi:predicted HTH domain antitoxin
MPIVTVEVPDIILNSNQQNIETVQEGLKLGLVIWEYLNGHLTLGECGNVLRIGYRDFLELLWSKGIPIDGLNEDELQEQVSHLRKILK